MIRVLSAGLFTTVQDLGRPGYCHLGVSAAGAADPISYRVANRLVGNLENAAAFELTLHGGRFAFDEECVASLCGADFDASIPMWRAVRVRGGTVVEVGGCSQGARCYLAVRGGIKAESYLGSFSTHSLSGMGRALQKEDLFVVGNCAVNPVNERTITVKRPANCVRVTAGAASEDFTGSAMLNFLGESWTVSPRSNRQAIRLEGGKLQSPGAGVMASEGVALGAVQVPPAGEPVILFVDSQTTGGYPVIANVASVDTGAVGQLRPGGPVRFQAVSFSEARRLLQEQEDWIRGV